MDDKERVAELEAEVRRLEYIRESYDKAYSVLQNILHREEEAHKETRLRRFTRFAEDECWIYDEEEDNDLASLVCPVVISPKYLKSVLDENAALRAHVESLLGALHGVLTPALLGAYTREDMIKDFGMLGVSHFDHAHKVFCSTPHQSLAKERNRVRMECADKIDDEVAKNCSGAPYEDGYLDGLSKAYNVIEKMMEDEYD